MKSLDYTHRSRKAAFALVAVLALPSLWVGAGATTASPATPGLATSAPDLRSSLSSELGTIERFDDDLVAYNKLCSQLAKRASLRQVDRAPAQRKASELSSGLSGVQSAIRRVVDKLKAANAWNDLDEKLAANADAKLRTLFQGSSFKQELEGAAANIGSQAGEINAPLNNLRRRVTGQTFSTDRSDSVVRVAYRPTATMAFGGGLGCRLSTIRVKLIKFLGGNPTNQTLDVQSCRCNPSKGIGIGTATPCAEVLDLAIEPR
jgi:hypothetical protein